MPGSVQDERAPLRLLIVEDECIIAEWLSDIIVSLGHVCVAICATAAEALACLDREQIDAALVDLNLKGARSYPVIDRILQMGKTAVISTAFYPLNLPVAYRECPILHKPYDRAQLEDLLRGLRP